MTADFDDLQGSEASDICVKRFKSQELFGAKRYEFSLHKRNIETSHSSKTVIDSGGNFLQEDDV